MPLCCLFTGLLNQYPFWIGLNDREKEGDYIWSSGEKYPYRNWHKPSEPNGHNHSADCADMLRVNTTLFRDSSRELFQRW